MPGETPGAKLPSPWKDFLGEIDKALEKPLEIHCIGGFALVFYYGIPRTTGDIDYYTAVPSDLNLEEIAGHDSDLHRRYKIYLHRVTVATLPEEYEERLSEMASGQFERWLSWVFSWVQSWAHLEGQSRLNRGAKRSLINELLLSYRPFESNRMILYGFVKLCRAFGKGKEPSL